MRIIGYCRVSSEQQAQNGVSLAAQEERIRAYATFVGAEVVDVVFDRGLSGRKADRPGKGEAVERVLRGEADVLVVYAIDRLSRSTIDLLETVRELVRAERGFVSCREQLDSSTPHGRFTLTILAAIAEMESELISERTREAMRRCMIEGRQTGATPYGYRVVRDRVVPYPEEQEVVDRILALRDAGVTYRDIAAHLEADGVPPRSGRRWWQTSVRSIEVTSRKRRALQKSVDG